MTRERENESQLEGPFIITYTKIQLDGHLTKFSSSLGRMKAKGSF